MKLATVHGESWWVPDTHPIALAVPISMEQEYLPAIRDKLERLVRKVGVPRAMELMEGVGLEPEPTKSPERLVEQLLETMDVGSMVREGSPWMAQPADQATAADAVETQAELRLEDFLG